MHLFTMSAQATIQYNEFEQYSFKKNATFPVAHFTNMVWL